MFKISNKLFTLPYFASNKLLKSQFCISSRVNAFKRGLPRVLITGGLGQIGIYLARSLRHRYGTNNVILSDVTRPNKMILEEGPYTFADILNLDALRALVVNYQIDWIFHLGAILSSSSEINVPLAMKVNIEGVHNIFELAKQYNLRLFIPSTIAVFGSDSPHNLTPDVCVQRPKTIYGIAKVHTERLGEYYNYKYGLDFRSLRLPGIISADTQPGGGTTDYSVEIFHQALKHGSYECYLSPHTRLPMMFIDDCIKAFIQMMEAPSNSLTLRTYNISAVSFTPEILADEIKKYIPDFQITYKPDMRQKIAEEWPQVLDDTNARKDWNWNYYYDLNRLCFTMIESISKNMDSPYLDYAALEADNEKYKSRTNQHTI